MSYLAKKLIQNPAFDIKLTVSDDALVHLINNRQNLEPQITYAFDVDASELSLDSFITAVGLYGLASTIATLYTPAKSIKDALELIPQGLDELDDFATDACENSNDYRTIWIIGAGAELLLGKTTTRDLALVSILKVIHQHKAVGNYDLDIDHLHSGITVEKYDAQKCAEFFKNSTNLDAFYDIAKDAVVAHVGLAKAQTGDYGLSTADLERINQLDSAVLSVMRFACVNYYDLPVRLDYANKDILAPFMAVYELFQAFVSKDLLADISKQIG